MRILYAVGSWGLGHATRSLPLIAGLLDAGATLTVVSTGRALPLLRAGTKTAEAVRRSVALIMAG